MTNKLTSFLTFSTMRKQRVDAFKLVIQHGEFEGTEYPLPNGKNILGRWDPESASFPEIDLAQVDSDIRISRIHAKVEVEPGRVVLEDLNSLNGTYVNNGNKLQPGVRCSLQVEDEIIIGKTVFRLKAA